MFRFNFDFEETAQPTATHCSQNEEAQITPCENENSIVSVTTLSADRPQPTEAELKAFSYDKKILARYFMAGGWTERSAGELARGMIERGSFLPTHEQVKYLECEKQENE